MAYGEEIMEPKEEKEVMRRRIGIKVRGPDDAVVSIFRGGEPSDSQSLTFEQVKQFMMDLQNALFEMGTRR